MWDWPLRLWHWLLVMCVTIALITGLFQNLDLMNLHTWAGMAVVALLVFRLIWGIVGGTYARFRNYWTTPRAFLQHFVGKVQAGAHTSPGIVLAVCIFVALSIQGVAGLFTTDDIFIEGPLVQFVEDDVAEFATDVHQETWKFILALIGIHLTAHLVYGLVLRDSLPLSMVTGNKLLDIPPTNFSSRRATTVWLFCVLVFWVLFYYSR